MEYCSGSDLAEKIAKVKESRDCFSDDEICQVVVQVGRDLSCLHQTNKMHRDVKPENIPLVENGTYKLGDFGLVALMERSVSRRVSCVGTDGYMAPEVLQGKEYGFAADVFSFGVVLYEMITLTNPYILLGEDGIGTYSKALTLSGNIPPLQSSNHSRELISLVLDMLLVDVEKRTTISEMLGKKVIAEFILRKKL